MIALGKKLAPRAIIKGTILIFVLFCIILSKREFMIGIICAYFKEAKPLIRYFNLKKINDKFSIYENEKISLIISGQGKINSSIATTYLLSTRDISNIINFGIAGSGKYKIGDIFLINKINDKLFPDILISHPFRESEIICFDEVVTGGEYNLVDMESEGFFKASIKFLKAHQIYLIKIVSDNLVCFRPDDKFMDNLINPHLKDIEKFINSLNESKSLDLKIVDELAKKYDLSFSQKEQLKNRVIYYVLNNFKLPNIDFEKTNRKNDFRRVMNEFKI